MATSENIDNSIITLPLQKLPKQLKEIPHPPKRLYCLGTPPKPDGKFLVIVGSRNHSTYAEAACKKIISELAGTDIYIVSGLALGIDTIAHETALAAGLPTIAFPGSGLHEKVLYPANNFSLAQRIIQHGGALLSEFPEDFRATPWAFPKRNRLMAGIAHAVLVIEAQEKSGTLITARMALDYNRDVLAVPGDITSYSSRQTNNLTRQGATPITCGNDIRELFGIPTEEAPEKSPDELSDFEKEILACIHAGKSKEEIFSLFPEKISECIAALMQLEIQGYDLPKETFNDTN